MKLRFLDAAEKDLTGIAEYSERDSPKAARRLVQNIRNRVRRMAETRLVDMGRPGPVPGTRELIEGRYLILYRYDPERDEIRVLSVVHGARRR